MVGFRLIYLFIFDVDKLPHFFITFIERDVAVPVHECS